MPAPPAPRTVPPRSDTPVDRRRYRRITSFFAYVILNVIFWDLIVGRIWGVRRLVTAGRPNRYRRLSRRFRDMSVTMGGVMIKLGQFLSVRVDVLPPEITEELQGLQDEVPAVPIEAIYSVIHEELGDPYRTFAAVEERPLAAASLGQTHRAWLLHRDGRAQRGEPVVIKVQRPGIADVVRTDLAALTIVARWVMRYRPIRNRADVPALLDEFAVTLWEEVDYRTELENAERFRSIFSRRSGVYVPRFFAEFCTTRLLVMENVEGLKLTDRAALQAAGIDPNQVADRLLESYYHQVFEEAFFHADPHPGNLFIKLHPERRIFPNEPTPFDLVYIDFGMMGTIPEETNDLLRQVLLSVTTRNVRGLTEAYDRLGFFLPGADLDRITQAQEEVLNYIWGRDLSELTNPNLDEVQEIGNKFKDLLFDFPFQVPQNFIYLGRALGIVSGIASLLNPTINPWYYVEQYGQRLLQSRRLRMLGIDSLLGTLREYLALPVRAKRVLDDLEHGRLKLQFKPDRNTEQQLDRLERRARQTSATFLTTGLLIAGAILYVGQEPLVAVGFWAAGGLLALWSALRG